MARASDPGCRRLRCIGLEELFYLEERGGLVWIGLELGFMCLVVKTVPSR